ncbi:MAG: thioredoxin domain-containing protein [Anaerolineae bacterium]|nr:thioredoxin domain-containing protein [Anaerolineae bacterium]
MTRSKAAERRQERQAEKRRQRLTSLVVVVIVAAILLIILVVLSTQPADAPIPEGTLTRYEGISQSRTQDGYARLGDPSAPVVVELYSSVACPSCKVFHDAATDDLIDRVKSGNVQLIYVPLTTGSVTNANGAARTLICATEQGKFWELQDVMFSWQETFGNQAFTNNRIIAALDGLGIDTEAHNACLNSERPRDVLFSAEQDAGGLLNFIGTPTIAINGVVPVNEDGEVINDAAAIINAIDAAIAQMPSSNGSAATTPEPTQASAGTDATVAPTGSEEPTETAEPTTAPTETEAPTEAPEATATPEVTATSEG